MIRQSHRGYVQYHNHIKHPLISPAHHCKVLASCSQFEHSGANGFTVNMPLDVFIPEYTSRVHLLQNTSEVVESRVKLP